MTADLCNTCNMAFSLYCCC